MAILNFDIGVKDFVTPEMFGAVGDGITDDTAAIRAALDYATPHDRPVIGNNWYYVEGLEIKSEDQISLNRLISNGLDKKAIVFNSTRNAKININRADVEGTVFYFEPSYAAQQIFHVEIHVGKVQGHAAHAGHCNKFMHINSANKTNDGTTKVTGVENIYVHANTVYCNYVLYGETGSTSDDEGWFGEICFIGGHYTASVCAVDIMDCKNTGIRFVCSSLENSAKMLKTNKGLTSFTETRLEFHGSGYAVEASGQASVRIYSYSLNPSYIDVSGLTEKGSFVMTASNTHYGSGATLQADDFPTYMVYNGHLGAWSTSPKASVKYADNFCTNFYNGNSNYNNYGKYASPVFLQGKAGETTTLGRDLVKRIHSTGLPVFFGVSAASGQTAATLKVEHLMRDGEDITGKETRTEGGKTIVINEWQTLRAGTYMIFPTANVQAGEFDARSINFDGGCGLMICALPPVGTVFTNS